MASRVRGVTRVRPVVAKPALRETPPAGGRVAPALQPDATLIGQQALNMNTYNQTVAGLTAQEQGVRQAYGFDDTSNPFSRAANLQRAYETRGRSNTNSYAGQGQLYSGALQNAQNESQRQFVQDDDSARRSYQSDLDAIAQRKLGAKTALDQGNMTAFASSVERQLAVRPSGDPDATPATAASSRATRGSRLAASSAGSKVGAGFKPKKRGQKWLV